MEISTRINEDKQVDDFSLIKENMKEELGD